MPDLPTRLAQALTVAEAAAASGDREAAQAAIERVFSAWWILDAAARRMRSVSYLLSRLVNDPIPEDLHADLLRAVEAARREVAELLRETES